MRRFHSLCLAATLLACLPMCSRQPREARVEVPTLLAKMAEARGGWAKVRTVRAIRNRFVVQLPNKTYQVDELLLPDHLYREDNYLGHPRTRLISPQIGLVFVTGSADTQLNADERDSWSTTFRFNSIFLLQQASNPAYEFRVLGAEKIGEADTTILEVKGYSVRDWLYVDSRTGRVLRAVEFDPDGSRTTSDYSDWVMADGITLPLSVKGRKQGHNGQTVWEAHISAIEFNPPLDNRLFEPHGVSLRELPFHSAPVLPAPEPLRSAATH